LRWDLNTRTEITAIAHAVAVIFFLAIPFFKVMCYNYKKKKFFL